MLFARHVNRMIKSMDMRLVGHVARTEAKRTDETRRDEKKRKEKTKGPLGRSKSKWEYNIKVAHRGIEKK